jgi:hypothetical protein
MTRASVFAENAFSEICGEAPLARFLPSRRASPVLRVDSKPI